MTQDDAPSQDTRRREQAIARCDRPRAPFNCTSAPRTQGIDRTKKPTPKSHCSETPSTGVNRPAPQGSTAHNRPGRQRNRGSPTEPESPTRQEARVDRWSSTTTACDPNNAENLGSPSHVRQDGESHWRLPRRRGDRPQTTASRRRLTADSPPMGESTSPQPRSLTNVPHHPARGDQPRRPDIMQTDTAPTPTPGTRGSTAADQEQLACHPRYPARAGLNPAKTGIDQRNRDPGYWIPAGAGIDRSQTRSAASTSPRLSGAHPALEAVTPRRVGIDRTSTKSPSAGTGAEPRTLGNRLRWSSDHPVNPESPGMDPSEQSTAAPILFPDQTSRPGIDLCVSR